MMDYGAIAQAGADTLGSWLNFINQYATNKQEVHLANTAHVREVADLKAAGLNPVLSAMGRGAATPNLEAPQLTVPNFMGIANSAADVKVKKATAENIDEQTNTQKTQQNLNSAQEAKSFSEAGLNNALWLKAFHEADAASANAKNAQLETSSRLLDLIKKEADTSIYKGKGGKILPWVDKLLGYLPDVNIAPIRIPGTKR